MLALEEGRDVLFLLEDRFLFVEKNLKGMGENIKYIFFLEFSGTKEKELDCINIL